MTTNHPDSIVVLPGLESIRRRPELYVPNLSSGGLHWLIGEVVQAAITPACQNGCSQLRLLIGSDGALTLIDNGRGLPIRSHAQDEPRSVLDIALTTLFAGRAAPSPSVYAHYGFLLRSGPILNALSESLSITTHRDGQTYRTSYSRGSVTEPLHLVDTPFASGSVIRVVPDRGMWNEPDVVPETLCDVLRPLAIRDPAIPRSIQKILQSASSTPTSKRIGRAMNSSEGASSRRVSRH
jgi:DNA gyrase subunit B